MKTLRSLFTDVELDVVRLRSDGYSFAKISRDLGFHSYQRVQQLYKAAIKKADTLRVLTYRYPSLLNAMLEFDYPYRSMAKLCKILLNDNLIGTYMTKTEDELLAYKDIGSNYVKVLKRATELYTATHGKKE